MTVKICYSCKEPLTTARPSSCDNALHDHAPWDPPIPNDMRLSDALQDMWKRACDVGHRSVWARFVSEHGDRVFVYITTADKQAGAVFKTLKEANLLCNLNLGERGDQGKLEEAWSKEEE